MAWYLENYNYSHNYSHERGYKAIMYFGEDYILTDEKTLIMGAHLSKRKHRFIFKTAEGARLFAKAHSDHSLFKHCSPKELSDYSLPNCNRECRKCNKKKKVNCRNLRNPMQNHCGFTMASFPENVVIDPKRLDTSCEKCLTNGCPYNMYI